MNDVEKGIKCIQLAQQNKNKFRSGEYNQMINEIKTHKVFANFRKDERVQKLIS
jgi:hypothetical protein